MINSLYIHIPFCKSICPYCDFYKRVSCDKTMAEYRDDLILELELSKESLKDIQTIYIGGGTPTAFSYLEDVLKKISEVVDISKVIEYTIEATPETIETYIKIFKQYGINRVSIGVESFNNKTLNYIKRTGSNLRDLKRIRNELNMEGIFNINYDMIYALPYETLYTLRRGISFIERLKPNHISYYDLIIEDNTILKHDLDNNKISLPDEDTNIKMRDFIEKRLNNLGYIQYEISNYAKASFESIHNEAYWECRDYIGIGSGAHSLVDNKRYYNTKSLKTYALLKENKNLESIRCYYECEPMKEYFLIGLRMNKGVSLDGFKNRFNQDPLVLYKDIEKSIDEGLLVIDDGYLKFTDKGRHLGNLVFEIFV